MKLVTELMLMPKLPVLLTRSWVSETLRELVRLMPTPVVLVIKPPEPFSTPVPSPVTVSPPLDPVLLRAMPFAPPPEEILWNVSPLAPMVTR